MDGSSSLLPSQKKPRLTPFMIYFVESKSKFVQGKIHPIELTKIIAEGWKNIPPEKKRLYVEMSEIYSKENYGYDTALQAIKNAQQPKQKKPREKRDPNLPKPPSTAFQHYSKFNRASLRQQAPQLQFPEVNKRLGAMWKDAPAAEKQRFEEMAQHDKTRYEAEMSIYREKQHHLAPEALQRAGSGERRTEPTAPPSQSPQPQQQQQQQQQSQANPSVEGAQNVNQAQQNSATGMLPQQAAQAAQAQAQAAAAAQAQAQVAQAAQAQAHQAQQQAQQQLTQNQGGNLMAGPNQQVGLSQSLHSKLIAATANSKVNSTQSPSLTSSNQANLVGRMRVPSPISISKAPSPTQLPLKKDPLKESQTQLDLVRSALTQGAPGGSAPPPHPSTLLRQRTQNSPLRNALVGDPLNRMVQVRIGNQVMNINAATLSANPSVLGTLTVQQQISLQQQLSMLGLKQHAAAAQQSAAAAASLNAATSLALGMPLSLSNNTSPQLGPQAGLLLSSGAIHGQPQHQRQQQIQAALAQSQVVGAAGVQMLLNQQQKLQQQQQQQQQQQAAQHQKQQQQQQQGSAAAKLMAAHQQAHKQNPPGAGKMLTGQQQQAPGAASKLMGNQPQAQQQPPGIPPSKSAPPQQQQSGISSKMVPGQPPQKPQAPQQQQQQTGLSGMSKPPGPAPRNQPSQLCKSSQLSPHLPPASQPKSGLPSQPQLSQPPTGPLVPPGKSNMAAPPPPGMGVARKQGPPPSVGPSLMPPTSAMAAPAQQKEKSAEDSVRDSKGQVPGRSQDISRQEQSEISSEESKSDGQAKKENLGSNMEKNFESDLPKDPELDDDEEILET